MKKHFLSLFLAPLILTSCNNSINLSIKGYGINLNLNDPNASFTDEWKEERGVTAKNIMLYVNLNSYKSIVNSLPKVDDINAPEGKIFAGWYFDVEGSAGQEWSHYNLNQYVEANEDRSSVNIYCKWIDISETLLIYDLNDDNYDFAAKYTDSFNSNNHLTYRSPTFTIKNDNYVAAVSYGATANDIVTPNESLVFGGWFFADGDPLNKDTLKNKVLSRTEGDIRVYAHWKKRARINFRWYLDAGMLTALPGNSHFGGFFKEEIYTEYAKHYQYSWGNYSCQLSYSMYLDEFDSIEKVNNLTPKATDYVKTDVIDDAEFAKYTITAWKLMLFDDETGLYVVDLTYANIMEEVNRQNDPELYNNEYNIDFLPLVTYAG